MVGLASSSPVVALVLLSARATAFGTGPSTSRLVVNLRHGHVSMQATAGIKGYFSLRDVQLIERRQEDVDAFNAKERNRWDVVYEEECPESLLESLLANGYFPGDRVKIVNDVKVKDLEIWLSKTSRPLIPQLSSHTPVKIRRKVVATARHPVTSSLIKTQLRFCNEKQLKRGCFLT